jgi:hypothetical protein
VRLPRIIGTPVSESAARYVIGLVSFMYVAWAVLLLWLPGAGRATPVNPVSSLLSYRALAVAVFLGAAVAAQVAMWFHFHPRHAFLPDRFLVLALLPQQFLLLVSAFGGIRAAVLGHYADGTVRPWQFIVADQLPVILLALIYTTAMLAMGRVRNFSAPGRGDHAERAA